MEIVVGATKACWREGVEVRGFHHRRKEPAITAKHPGTFDITVPSVNASIDRGRVTRLFSV